MICVLFFFHGQSTTLPHPYHNSLPLHDPLPTHWEEAEVHRAQLAITQGPENEAYVKFEPSENMLMSQIEDVNDSLSRDMQAEQQRSSMG